MFFCVMTTVMQNYWQTKLNFCCHIQLEMLLRFVFHDPSLWWPKFSDKLIFQHISFTLLMMVQDKVNKIASHIKSHNKPFKNGLKKIMSCCCFLEFVSLTQIKNKIPFQKQTKIKYVYLFL